MYVYINMYMYLYYIYVYVDVYVNVNVTKGTNDHNQKGYQLPASFLTPVVSRTSSVSAHCVVLSVSVPSQ